MPRVKRILVLVVVLLACAGCDQATKSAAQQVLAGQPTREFGDGLLRLGYAQNPGAFLSLGASLSPPARFWIFTVFASVLLIGLIVFAVRMSPRTPFLMVVAIALMIGGGLSNLIDRLLHDGLVVDFLQVGIGPLRTGIFNVADVAIMGGLALALLAALAPGRGELPEQ
jgi:signal peptidase II